MNNAFDRSHLDQDEEEIDTDQQEKDRMLTRAGVAVIIAFFTGFLTAWAIAWVIFGRHS